MAGGHLFRAICRLPQQDNGHLCGHFSSGPGNTRSDHEARMHVACSTKSAAIHVGTVSGRYSFCPGVYFRRSVFHFPRCPASFPGSPPHAPSYGPVPTILLRRPASLLPPPVRPVFYPYSIHTRAFTFDESRWNYPLHSRGQWSSVCGVKG